jgi:hypothetical protein
MAIQHGIEFPLGSPAWEGRETLTQSTATAFQTLSKASISVLGMGTATSHIRNRYALATTNVAEGTEKLVVSLATGEAYLFVAGPTNGRLPIDVAFEMLSTATTTDALLASATGMYVFNADGDAMLFKLINGTWNPLYAKGVTQATAT